MGDFNYILSNEDKRGQLVHPPWLIRDFQEAVLDCNLHDLPMEGYQFTWTKCLGTEAIKEERLDRILVN